MFCVLVLAWLFLPIYIAAGVSKWEVVSINDFGGFTPPAWLLGLAIPCCSCVAPGSSEAAAEHPMPLGPGV